MLSQFHLQKLDYPFYVREVRKLAPDFVYIVYGVLRVRTLWTTTNIEKVTESFDPWAGKIPWRRQWQPTPVLLPGASHGRRSLVGYSLQGRKEADTTEQLSTAQHTSKLTCLFVEKEYFCFAGTLNTSQSVGQFHTVPAISKVKASFKETHFKT